MQASSFQPARFCILAYLCARSDPLETDPVIVPFPGGWVDATGRARVQALTEQLASRFRRKPAGATGDWQECGQCPFGWLDLLLVAGPQRRHSSVTPLRPTR